MTDLTQLKQLKGCIYTRVSTQMQVEGYSLDAQRERILREAKHRRIKIVGEYTDEGKSGKNITDRQGFRKMLSDIAAAKPGERPDYVMVFKLSRFGRNAADTMNSYQYLKDYNVELLCVEDGLDTSNAMGSFMVAVLGAVAEMERENILAQTMAGRMQKARAGKWNGGFAPFGYRLEKNAAGNRLVVVPEAAECVKKIFEYYLTTNYGINGVAKMINEEGLRKPKEYMASTGNLSIIDTFSGSFVKGVLDNPVYMGMIAYGRRKTEPIEGERNEFHIVKQPKDTYELYEGEHEAIISKEDWYKAQAKRETLAKKHAKSKGNKYHHVLSGLIRCPLCDAPMYGIAFERRRKDGGKYPPNFYYKCHNRIKISGHNCDYRRNIPQKAVEEEVDALVRFLMMNKEYTESIEEAAAENADVSGLEAEMAELEKKAEKERKSKEKFCKMMLLLDPDADDYDNTFLDYQNMLITKNQRIAELESDIAKMNIKIEKARTDSVSVKQMNLALEFFFENFEELPKDFKQEMMQGFIDRIDVFPEKQADGRWVKSIRLKVPVIYNGEKVDTFYATDEDGDDVISLSIGSHDETCVLLSHQQVKKSVTIDYTPDGSYMKYVNRHATYKEINEYVEEKYGFKLHSAYIAQVKREMGIEMGENYNLSKSDDYEPKQVTPEKRAAIIDALKHFNMIE